MQKFIWTIFLLTTALLISCTPNKTPAQLKELFFQNKTNLNKLVNDLRNKEVVDFVTSNEDHTINVLSEKFPETYQLANDIGITELVLYEEPGCKRIKQFFLRTNWPNEYPIHLIFNSCDSIGTKKEYYSKDEVSNEAWGLGDNWQLFRFVQAKTMKQ